MARLRILVCGGRNFGDVPKNSAHPDYQARLEEHLFIFRILNEIAPTHEDCEYNMPNCVIISGKARGADSAAIDWAIVNWVQFEEYPADWDKYKKSAGFIRNQQMLDEGKPDLVVAFPGGNGTAHMVRIAKQAGIEVKEIPYGGPEQV